MNNTNTINFDPRDFKGMIDLMKRHEEFEMPYFGKNEDDENVIINVNENNITVVTMQSNNWVRENIYHDDGVVEELFRR